MGRPSKLASVHRILHEHAWMVEREQELQRSAYPNSIQALMEALEALNPLTRGHSERVRFWAVRIARQLGKPASKIEALELAARTQVIGKVGVQDAVLEKPGLLSIEEWQILRRHPLVGLAILQPIQFLQAFDQEKHAAS